jgi:hypothetical protein
MESFISKFTNWYFAYGWLLIITVCGVTMDIIMSSYNVKNKDRYITVILISMSVLTMICSGTN